MKPNATTDTRSRRGIRAGERRRDAVLELAQRQPRGIPHDVGPVAQPGEGRALRGDRFAETDPVLAERMAAARLAVAADQRFVLGVEEQHFGLEARCGQLVERGDRIAERAERAHVERERGIAVARLGGERDERAREDGRRVVQAREPEVLERFHRLALARAREPRYDDETPHMKLFSADKANALIPVLEPLLEELWSKRRDLAIRLLETDPALRMGPADALRDRRRSRAFTELKAEIVRLINRIEAHGCVVKNIDVGLLDFPSMRDGRPVYLCWKAGEPELTHWHGTDESFVDRKPL